jgi:hypothetical protein
MTSGPGRRCLAALAALLLGGAVPAASGADAAAAIRDWEYVLDRYVDAQGRTDFAAAAADRAALDRFVAYVGSHGPRTTPAAFAGRAEQLAFHINAYNALALAGVLDEGIPADFGTLWRRAAFFRFRAVTVDGQRTNLYDYENRTIRPLGEPRVHFALNCMVRACPRLPRAPFRPETLEASLDAAAREFFASDRHLRVDPVARTVAVSAILDFYTGDFASSGSPADLIPYINRYRSPAVPPDYRLRFIPYDWTVNRRPAGATPSP